mgnify:FL=1
MSIVSEFKVSSLLMQSIVHARFSPDVAWYIVNVLNLCVYCRYINVTYVRIYITGVLINVLFSFAFL